MSEYVITDEQIKRLFNGNFTTLKMKHIIRCRDCKKFGLEDGEEPPTLEHCRKYVQFGGIREVDPNGFCAWAEPKEEE